MFPAVTHAAARSLALFISPFCFLSTAQHLICLRARPRLLDAACKTASSFFAYYHCCYAPLGFNNAAARDKEASERAPVKYMAAVKNYYCFLRIALKIYVSVAFRAPPDGISERATTLFNKPAALNCELLLQRRWCARKCSARE